jgi:hypothetical protein
MGWLSPNPLMSSGEVNTFIRTNKDSQFLKEVKEDFGGVRSGYKRCPLSKKDSEIQENESGESME